MLPTLRAILDSPAVQQGRPQLLSGRRHLDRGVRWVHVVEITDLARLLTGGELILSTGLPLVGDGAESFVTGLVEADAAGLVVELGPGLPAIPDAAITAARAVDFPLIALHAEVRFVDITEEVHRAIVAEQYAFVDFARSTHETFTALSLESADALRIVTAAADLCGLSVVLEDLSRRVLAYAARGRPAARLLARWEERSRQAAALPETGVTGPEGWMTTPVGGQGRAWARLVVPDPGSGQDLLAMVLERAAQALELGRMAERDRAGLVTSAHGGLLTELSLGRIATEGEAAARAGALGLPEAALYLPLVVHRLDAAADDPVARHERTRRVVEQVVDAAARTQTPALVGSLRLDQIGVLAAIGRGDPEQLLDRLTAPLANDLVVGVGEPAAGVLAAGTSLALAGHVAEVAAALRRPGRRWFRNADVRLHGLIALLHDDPRVQAFTEAELGPLLAHDGARGTDLVGLLRQYVAAGGNKTRLAAATHRSRPALYKQLAQVEDVLGVDLTDPDSFLALGVALLAYDRGR
ncbi:PucR family transcriptional regulator [Nocardioides ginsengisoli]|uniref:PucR family transcriptional regulator n=1 Tax=Nocardioides ginsengisoli TaxID=363868 RepID=A0ABW3VXP4_9ACTN